MALTVAELNTKLTADTRDLQTGLRRAERDITGFSGKASSSLAGVGKQLGLLFGAQQLLQFGKSAVMMASNVEEATSKVNVVFGESAGVIRDWAGNAASSIGLAQREALTFAGTFGNMFDQLGFASDVAARMSTSMVNLAADLGSFNDLPTEQVLEGMNAAFRGEYDSLQRVIPTINAAAVETKALAMTGKDSAKQLTMQEKAAATYRLVLDGAGAAAGDFSRTSGSMANQLKIATAEFDNAKAELGAGLLPVVTDAIGLFATAIQKTKEWGDEILSLGGKVENVDKQRVGKGGLGAWLDSLINNWSGVAEETDKAAAATDNANRALTYTGPTFQEVIASLDEENLALAEQNEALGETADAAREAAQALDDLKDAQFAARDAAYALEDAHQDAAEAQDELNRLLASGGVDAEKVARATEDVATAQTNLNEALAAAGERILRDVESATEDLAKANEKLADQTQSVADAEAKLSKLKAQRKARDEAIKNARAQLAAADTVTERIIAQDALDAALGMEIVTDKELAAAQSNVTTESDKLESATDGVTQAARDLSAAQAQQPADFDSVKDATKRLDTAQRGLNEAQQQSPTFAADVAAAQRGVEQANYGVEKATWAAEKAQRAYNDALNATPSHVSTTVTRNEIVNVSRNETINIVLPQLPPALGNAGTVVPLQMRPTLVMHDGGMVPGPRGADVPAILQAGETVIPAGQSGGMGGGITVIVEGSVITERDLGRVVADAIRNNGLYGVN